MLQALLAAVWCRKPEPGLLLHSDQGSQFTSEDWQSLLKAHGIVCSVSRRGNCHDNAAMESFFQLLKRERINQRIYSTLADARGDVFDYIELSYTPKRRHSSNDGLSPIEFEKAACTKRLTSVYKNLGDSLARSSRRVGARERLSAACQRLRRPKIPPALLIYGKPAISHGS